MKKINFSILIFLISFSIYAITCAPSVTFEDSGEFIVSITHLGIAHPPGYPLYILIAKLIYSITHSIFFINLLSAFFSALSMTTLFLVANIILKSKIKSFLAILFFSISSSLWANSTITEVYALNLFLFSLQLLLLLKLNIKFKKKYLFLLVFLNGLSLSNHQTSIFLSLTIIFMFFYNKWFKQIKKVDIGYLIGLFFIGISVYFYLIIRSQSFPLMNWGNPDNIKNFIYVVLREQYGSFSIVNIKTFLHQIGTVNPLFEFYSGYNSNLNTVYSIIILLLLITIFYFNYKKIKKNIFISLLIIFILYTFFLIIITNTPSTKLFTLKSFFIPAWAVLYILIFNFINSRYLQIATSILFIFLLIINFEKQNKRNYFYTRDYIKNLLNNLSFNSIIFTVKDNETFPLWEMQYVENYRPDIKIINLVLSSEDWYLYQLKKIYPEIKLEIPYHIKNKFLKRGFVVEKIISNNKLNIYFTTKNYNKFLNLDISLLPAGEVLQLNKNFLTNIILYHKFSNFSDYEFKSYFFNNSVHKYRPDIYLDLPTRYMLQQIANLFYSTGEYLYENKKFNPAMSYYQKSSFYNYLIGVPINNVYDFYKIGQIYLKNGLIEKYKYFSIVAAKLQPNSKFARNILNEIKSVNKVYTENFRKAEKFYKNKKFKQAIELYKKLLQYNKPIIYTSIADCYFNLNNLDKAIVYYKKAIASDKKYITPYYNLGGCYYMKKDYITAKKIWMAGLKIESNNKLLLNAIKNFK